MAPAENSNTYRAHWVDKQSWLCPENLMLADSITPPKARRLHIWPPAKHSGHMVEPQDTVEKHHDTGFRVKGAFFVYKQVVFSL